MAFWDRVFADVARDYPDIRTESLLVDAACMDLVRRPRDFDVIVASNLFGDILTDLSAAITGSLGLAPSANLNPAKTFPVDVRAGARLGAGHRRPGHRQPDGDDARRRDDAGLPRRSPPRPRSSRRRSSACSPTGKASRRISAARERPDR